MIDMLRSQFTVDPRRVAWALGIGAWLAWIEISAVYAFAALRLRPTDWLYDWSVYLAGARALANRTLYRQPLHDVGLPMSATEFKLPPFAAVPALPLAWLEPTVAGVIWAILNLAAFAFAAWALVTLLDLRPRFIWAGVTLGFYAIYNVYPSIVVLGNINPLVLGLVAGFAWAHIQGRQRTAGVLLGLAIAIKLWPLALLLVIMRERRWTALGWATGFLVLQAIVILAWLGPEVVGPLLWTTQADIRDSPFVSYVSWLDQTVSWWPAWGGVAVAAVLLLIRAHGRAGVGLGILAGLAVVPNLWDHYQPTLFFGLLLLLADIRAYVVAWLRPAEELPADPARGGALGGYRCGAVDRIP